MDISKLDRATVLAALYNHARSQGMVFLHHDPDPMTVEQAQKILATGQTYFDYVKGRVMKVDLSKDFLDTQLYDRNNGPDAAENAILEELTRPSA